MPGLTGVYEAGNQSIGPQTRRNTLMENGIYYNPTKILFGKNMEEQIGAEIAPYAERVLLVSGQKRAEQAGLLDRVRESLKKADVQYVELAGVHPNPVLSTVWEGIRLARREAVSLILAVGGGSVIDTAKAIAAGTPNTEDVWEYFEGTRRPASVLPVGVVLTISGSGSESSSAMVIRNDETDETRTYHDDRVRPVVAVLDPVSTYSLPAYNTASGIADAACHVMEKYFTNSQNVDITDRLCEAVLTTIFETAPQAVEKPRDYAAKSNIMWASKVAHDGTLAVGRQRDTAARTLAHELTTRHGIPNGAALAVLFPAWLTYVASHDPKRMQMFASRIAGVDPGDPDAAAKAVDYVKQNFVSWGLPATLAELGVGREEFEKIAAEVASQNDGTIGAYVPIDQQGILEILKIAAGD